MRRRGILIKIQAWGLPVKAGRPWRGHKKASKGSAGKQCSVRGTPRGGQAAWRPSLFQHSRRGPVFSAAACEGRSRSMQSRRDWSFSMPDNKRMSFQPGFYVPPVCSCRLQNGFASRPGALKERSHCFRKTTVIDLISGFIQRRFQTENHRMGKDGNVYETR